MVERTPKVSVIVPSYNHAQFLPKRLDSIVNQTFSDIEIIILDDFSTDNSRIIIEDYAGKDNRIKTCFNVVNSGSPFRQWKKGIDLAKGDYIWIAESDDYADLRLLETLFETVKQNSSTGVAYCQSVIVDSKDKVIGNHLENLVQLDSTRWSQSFCIDGKEAVAKYMAIINIIPNASAAIFKKELAGNVDWDMLYSYRLAGDRFFWVSLLLKTRLCFVNDSLNYFRSSNISVRRKHVNTLSYLNEIKHIVLRINGKVKLSVRNKNRALRQWYRYYKAARIAQQTTSISFYYSSFKILCGLLTIYFRAK